MRLLTIVMLTLGLLFSFGRVAEAQTFYSASNGIYFGAPWFWSGTYPLPNVPYPACTGGAPGLAQPTAEAAIQNWIQLEQRCNGEPALECTTVQTYSVSDTGDVYSIYLDQTIPERICQQSGVYGDGEIQASPYLYDPTKNLGPPCDCAGDPINLGTGNEYRDDTDASLGDLSFHRYYNSHVAVASSLLGANWRDSFDRSIQEIATGNVTSALVLRADGHEVAFALSGTQWVAEPDVSDRLTQQTDGSGNVTGWTFFDAATRNQEGYNATGQLISITDSNGQVTSLVYVGVDLSTVTDSHGRTLTFAFVPLELTSGMYITPLTTVTLPDGGVVTYGYDPADGNLTSVTYPDASVRKYVYNESTLTSGTSLPNALTGVVDETNTRLTNIGYDSQGRAIMSSLTAASNIDVTSVSYGSGSSLSTSVTYPTGAQTTLSFATPNGSVHTNSVSAPCGPGCGQPNQSATFDANGYLATTTDFNGNVKSTAYDANGLLDQEVDDSNGTAKRTITTTWNTTLRVPLTRSVMDANNNVITMEAWVPNALGQTLAHCKIDPAQASSYACAATGTVPAGVRRWTYTYCTAVGTGCPLVGLMLTSTGPRTDLTQAATYSYYTSSSATSCGTPGAACYKAGDLHTVTDALGHVTTYTSYDADGRVTQITDANGVNTNMTYTPRGWLASRSVGGATTTMGYKPYGSVASITDPDGVITTFTYDTAHRLTDIIDAQGNDNHYTLDAAGDKTNEQIRTASGTVMHSLTRTYNAFGQITTLIDGLSHTIFNSSASGDYDGNGNLVLSSDALSFQRHQAFDGLNRLTSTIANYNGTDTATKNTTSTVSRDALDRLTGVIDPTALTTTTTYDGLSDPTALKSPDTGTSTDTYDAAGNRLVHTDAKSVVSTSAYDALNRLISTKYAVTTANVTYTYDEANTVTGCSTSSPIGRLTRMVENTVTTAFCYDAHGNIIEKKQVMSSFTDITNYSYTEANRLGGVSTPDHTAISYTHDSDGRISGVQVTPAGGTTAPPTVVSNITYLPFGPISSYTLGNGQTITRTYDANYRLTDLTSSALTLHFARDAMGDITALGNAPGASPATETYSYDPLYRLTAVTEAGGTALASYTYNPTGDRLSKTSSGLEGGAYLYTTGTHRISSIGSAARTNDADGNTTASVIGGNTYGFGYNGRNRLTVAQLNGSTVGTYTYNAVGERINKVATTPQAVTERYGYDETSHLIDEYGTTNRDYIWLGDLPVAVIDNVIDGSVTTSTVNYITADQLNTPRAVTNSAGTVIWSWAYQGNPFGEQQPTSTTGYVLNLRYPGQYYDAESGTNYNLFRNYEPAIGRYQQSDPLGLAGGTSTYAYVRGNPMMRKDPSGLADTTPLGTAFCPGGFCTLPPDMVQNSWGAPNMAPVYILDGAAIAASGGLALPLASDAVLPVIANTLLAANVLNGAIELPEAIVTGAAPTEEVLSQELDYIIESFETPPPPPTVPVPTQPVGTTLAVPAGNQTTCPH